LSEIAADCEHLRREAVEILDGIRPALIGQRVYRYGRMWQIVTARVSSTGAITCYGVTVSRRGKVGTRGFDLGRLADCDFIDEPGQ
jgi:hypothetical protein